MERQQTEKPAADKGEIEREVERKNAEMYRQEQLAEKSSIPDTHLRDRDKTEADSFPTSDPPQPP